MTFVQLDGDNLNAPSIVYSIEQDLQGFVWLATEEGVYRHDSKSFKIYNNLNGLPENFTNKINRVLITDNGAIYIGSESGIALYDTSTDSFISIYSDAAAPRLISSLAQKDDGKVLAGAYNGVFQVDGDEIVQIAKNQEVSAVAAINKEVIFSSKSKVLKINNQKQEEVLHLKADDAISLLKHVQNGFLVGTKSGELYQNQLDLGIFDKIASFNRALFDIVEVNDGYLLATDGNGLLKLNKDFKIIETYTENDDEPDSITSNGVYDISIADSEKFWIATYGGGALSLKTNTSSFNVVKHEVNNENSLKTNSTRAIIQDRLGNVWYGTRKGISINYTNGNWKHIPSLEQSQEESVILDLIRDGNYVWAASYNHGLFKIDITSLEIKSFRERLIESDVASKVYALEFDEQGRLWAGGLDGKLAVIENDQVIDSYDVRLIRDLSFFKGKMYAAGRQGLTEIDENKVRKINKVNDNAKLNFSTLSHITSWNDELIISSTGNGLIFYQPLNKTVNALTFESASASNVVQSAIAVRPDQLWAATTNGLIRITLSSSDTLIHKYTEESGTASNEFNIGSVTKLDDGNLAFGGVNGVTIFDPENISFESELPKIYLQEFRLFGKKINPETEKSPLQKSVLVTDEISLNYDQNSFGFDFKGISHEFNGNLLYSWKLENFDENWSSPSDNNLANYTNLEPGKYKFQVIAIDPLGQSSEVRTVSIEITTPWYFTFWAFLIYFILLVLAILISVRVIRVLIKKKNADEQIAFFNNVTHEIKTPLTILLSSLENETRTAEGTQESQNQIKNTVKRINSLFEQMLNFHKVTSQNSIEQHLKEINLRQHFSQIKKDFQPLLAERNLKLEIDLNLKEDYFYHDRDIFDKVILNLLTNAIKYSNDGGFIKIVADNRNGELLELRIQDQGIGIPQDQQKHILNKYYRARNVANSQRPGTGLGLVMVKKLIERTDGTISFKSVENQGTTFFVSLKNLKEDFERKETHKQTDISNDPIQDQDLQEELLNYSDSKILVVEDNDDLRQIMVDRLSNYFQVFEAANGKEGFDLAHQQFPDLILSDLIMPEMDGLQMAQKIKEDINLNHIPVYLLTVLQNSKQKMEALEAGIAEYIEKPVDYRLMIIKIINSLKFQRQLREKYRHEQDQDTASLFKNEQDKEFLETLENNVLKNLGDDNYGVNDLSASMGMSRTSLYMKLKNLIDMSPQDFVISTKLKLAKKLLLQGDLSIKEVAFQCGFSNPKYFSTSFKKFYGTTPSGYIDSLKK